MRKTKKALVSRALLTGALATVVVVPAAVAKCLAVAVKASQMTAEDLTGVGDWTAAMRLRDHPVTLHERERLKGAMHIEHWAKRRVGADLKHRKKWDIHLDSDTGPALADQEEDTDASFGASSFH